VATPGKHSIYSLQKTAVLETLRIIRKVVHMKLEAWAVGITGG